MATVSSIAKPDKDITRKETHRSVSPLSLGAKILNKISTSQIQKYMKRVLHRDQVGFIPGTQLLFYKVKSMFFQTLNQKEENYTITLVATKKAFIKFNTHS